MFIALLIDAKQNRVWLYLTVNGRKYSQRHNGDCSLFSLALFQITFANRYLFDKYLYASYQQITNLTINMFIINQLTEI